MPSPFPCSLSAALLRVLAIAVACLSIAHAADERNLAARSEKRIALVIGNSAYPGAPLKNPVNDAKDMAAALRKLGFEVIDKTDATQKDMNLAIAQFGDKLRADTVALFFFAGHGMQVKGKNYIVPIDAQITSESTVRAMTVDVDTVMDQLAVSTMNIVILDACRNNPFERRFRSVGGGLAQMDAPKGSLIAYATAPGKVANDGDGRNGLYTQELLKHIQTPGLPLEAVFKRVRNGVMQGSGEAQTPWEASSLTGDFYFQGGSGGAQAAPAPQVASLTPQFSGARTAAQIEDELWDAIKDGDKPSVFEEYIKQYPKGRYLSQARVKIAKLKADARMPAAQAVVSPAPTSSATAANDTDTSLWNAVEKGGSADDYDVYLKQYPKGKYAALAKQRMQKLKDEARQQADAAEQSLWQAAERAPTAEAYAAYLARYPGGRYAALVPPRLAKVRAEVRLREEDEAWNQAQATATRAAMQAYLERYPDGRYLAQARQKDEEYQRVPPRPQIPVTVDEGIWRTIEASDMYRNLPRPRAIRVSHQASIQREYTGSKSSSLPTPAVSRSDSVRETTPLGDKCAAHLTSTTTDGKSSGAGGGSYACGYIYLGSTADGKTNGFIKSIDELKGSLFPMRIGARMSVRTQHAYVPDRKFDSTHASSCEVVSQGPARELHPRLEGKAWKLHCQGSYSSNYDNKTTATATDDYYLEDLGVMLSAIGVLNMQEKRFVMPQPGQQTVMVVEGEYGSRATTTYASYDWTVGK